MKPFKLFESNELERAELTIAAKGITSKLQRMAEDLAKIEANDLMPMSDQLKAAFGSQLAETFYSTTADQVRDLLQKVSESKGIIDNQILKLERIVNGDTNTDDLSDDVGFSNNDDKNVDDQDDADSSEIEPHDTDDEDIFAEPSSKEPEQKTIPTPPEGRMRKESFTFVDKKIVESFVRLLEKKVKPVIAAKRIAEQYSIPYANVVSVIKEAKDKAEKHANRVNNTKKKDIKEKWDTDYETPKSKRGMWDGWTIGELKSELKSLMNKKSRTDAEYTKVRQIQFAIRAKQKDRWGKISENIETGVEKHKPLIMIANRNGKNFTMKFHDYKDFQDWCNSNLSDDCTIKSVVNEAKLTKFVEVKKEKWAKENALKLDKSFVVDEDDDKWNVCGEQSKYCYGDYDSKKEALKKIEELEADKKEEDSKMKDALRKDKTFVIEKDLDDEDEEKKFWRVTGDVSDYCYGRYGSKKEALDRVEELRKKVK